MLPVSPLSGVCLVAFTRPVEHHGQRSSSMSRWGDQGTCGGTLSIRVAKMKARKMKMRMCSMPFPPPQGTWLAEAIQWQEAECSCDFPPDLLLPYFHHQHLLHPKKGERKGMRCSIRLVEKSETLTSCSPSH